MVKKIFSLEEQLAQLSEEQLKELKQEFTSGRASSQLSPKEEATRGISRGLLAGGKGALLALQGQSINKLDVSSGSGNELETFKAKERIKSDISSQDPTKNRRLDLDETKENRLTNESDIRQRRFAIDQLFGSGGEIGDEEIKEAEETLLQDLKPQLESGRGVPTIDKETGERKWRVLSNQEWNNKINQSKFGPTEIEHLQNIRSEQRAWTNVLDRLKDIGINPSSAGDIEFDVFNSPIGPVSIPARFNLFAQFSKDPKFTAVKKDIELAFQAFRKRVTGAQASDRELKLLRPLIASLKDRPEVFFEVINNAIENTEIAFNDRLDIYERAGRDVSEFTDFLPTTDPAVKRNGEDVPEIGGTFQGKKVINVERIE